MKKTLITPLALLFALIALVAAGCGSDDGGDSTSSTSSTETTATTATTATTDTSGDALSNEDYAAGLTDAIKPLGEQLQQFGADASSATSPDQVTQALDDTESAINDAIESVQALNPPEDVQSLNDDLISTLENYRNTVAETSDGLDGASQADATQIAGDFATESQKFATDLGDLATQFSAAGVTLGG